MKYNTTTTQLNALSYSHFALTQIYKSRVLNVAANRDIRI